MSDLFKKAVKHEKAGEFVEAHRLLERSRAEQCHDPGDIAFHLGWCLENISGGDRALAVRFYEEAAVKASTDLARTNSLFRAGWVLMQDGDHDRAEAFFRRAVDLAARSS